MTFWVLIPKYSSYEIFIFSGRKLFTREYKNYVIEIDNSTLKKGNYIIEVINTKGQIFKKQLVVE